MPVVAAEKEQKWKVHCFFSTQLLWQAKNCHLSRGTKVDGWFGVSKLLKETLIGASNSSFAKAKEVSTAARSFSNRPVSYANIVRGTNGGENYGQLRGWRCRACGSWDIYARYFRGCAERYLSGQ